METGELLSGLQSEREQYVRSTTRGSILLRMKREAVAQRLRVFVDADVLIAGAATPNAASASRVVLRLAEATVLEAVTSRQAVVEVERNLAAKLPDALPAFQRLLAASAITILDDPTPARLVEEAGKAHWKDLPLLIAASDGGCPFLVTFNLKDYEPGLEGVEVLRPGALVSVVRQHLAEMG